ncbi:hypothetical protein LguiA_012992 [Lonicera macranthoides]
MKAYYKQTLNSLCAILLVRTTQVLGYGWAGMFRRYLVDPVEMWWPATLTQLLGENREDFELGFFSFDNMNSYVGIWYKKVPTKTYVWVANKDTLYTLLRFFT